MIGHQQKGKKQVASAKSGGIDEVGSVKKGKSTGESRMAYNPELDKFSADLFIPEKHEEAEARLANSLIPPHF